MAITSDSLHITSALPTLLFIPLSISLLVGAVSVRLLSPTVPLLTSRSMGFEPDMTVLYGLNVTNIAIENNLSFNNDDTRDSKNGSGFIT